MLRSTAIAAFLPILALAQPVTPTHLQFEVASIRPVSPQEARVDLGMHIDGTQVRFNFLSLRDCLRIAYQMKDYQFVGPDWIASERYSILAKLPDGGATPDQIREMLQNLLLTRFKMTVHKDKKDFPVYALIPGKGGLKLKETPPDGKPEPEPGAALLDIKASGSAAGVQADLGNGSFFTFADNHLIAHKLPMWRIADVLSTFMDKPVVDMTGMSKTTNYDISLAITPEDYRTMQIRAAIRNGVTLPPQALALADQPTDSLSSALDDAGLKMESRKAPQDVIVVDKADKMPTDN